MTTSFLVAALTFAPLATAAPAQGGPTHAAEAAAKKAAADRLLDEQYDAWVSTLTPEQQAWERVLRENLGSFYLPIHKREKVAGRSNAWDFVEDTTADVAHPTLAKPLLVGNWADPTILRDRPHPCRPVAARSHEYG